MTNPFDPKTVFLAKHAQHVVLIYFPIALFITGVAFDAAAQWSKRQALSAVADYNLISGAFPVIASGLLAWQWGAGGPAAQGNSVDASGVCAGHQPGDVDHWLGALSLAPRFET